VQVRVRVAGGAGAAFSPFIEESPVFAGFVAEIKLCDCLLRIANLAAFVLLLAACFCSLCFQLLTQLAQLDARRSK
jgi:hypothetical protein